MRLFGSSAPLGRLLRQSLLAYLAIGGCASPPFPDGDADLVLRNGRIYTVDADRPWATAVAIRNGRFAAVGADALAARWTGYGTRVIDLQGRLVLPGFHDAHAHPVYGGLSYSQCPLHEGNTPEEYQELVANCLAEQPGDGWVFGVGWRPGVFPPDGVPHKGLLDAVAPDRPVAMRSIGGHSLWVNSRGLEVAGITGESPDPPQGRIDRDPETGEPVGGLQESATDLVADLLPPPSKRAREGALRYGNRYFSAHGIVGWQDANVSIAESDPAGVIDTYLAAARRGEIDGHVVLALLWDNARGMEQLPDLLAVSQRLQESGFEARTVKFFLDGVLGQRTAALLEPYSDAPAMSGALQIPLDVFNDAVRELDAKGYQIHVHAIGDRAIRTALDAFERARGRNGINENRHLISHANLVTATDQPRFAELDVIGVFQPLWARWDDYMRLTADRVGPERMSFMYPSGSLIRQGATVAFGSDWSVASANPFLGIEVAMTRREPGATNGKALLAGERISLEEAISAYTIDAARANRKDRDSGSVQPGKSADLIVLDRNVFEIPVHEVGKTQVLLTLHAGNAVHGDPSALGRR